MRLIGVSEREGDFLCHFSARQDFPDRFTAPNVVDNLLERHVDAARWFLERNAD